MAAFQNRAFNPIDEHLYENETTSEITYKADKDGNLNKNDYVLTDDVYMQLDLPREIEIVTRQQNVRNGPSLPPRASVPRASLDEPNAEEQRCKGVTENERRHQFYNENRNANVHEEPSSFTRRRLFYIIVILFSLLVFVILLVILQSVGVIGPHHGQEVQSQSIQGLCLLNFPRHAIQLPATTIINTIKIDNIYFTTIIIFNNESDIGLYLRLTIVMFFLNLNGLKLYHYTV